MYSDANLLLEHKGEYSTFGSYANEYQVKTVAIF